MGSAGCGHTALEQCSLAYPPTHVCLISFAWPERDKKGDTKEGNGGVKRGRRWLFCMACMHRRESVCICILRVYSCSLCTMRLLVGNHLSFRLNWSQLNLRELMQHDSQPCLPNRLCTQSKHSYQLKSKHLSRQAHRTSHLQAKSTLVYFVSLSEK